MARCVICDKSLSMFNQVKTADGVLCKDCIDKVPPVLKSKIGTYSLTTLHTIIQYTETPSFERFEETACYGRLHIDEMHGLFLISAKPEKIEQKDKANIFYVLDMSNVGLFCYNPRVFRNSVAVDIKFEAEFDPLNFSFSIDAKQQVFCISKKIQGGSKLEWDEPSELSVFRNMFNQMIRNESDKFNRKYKSIFMDKAELDIFRARCLFMIDESESFSRADLKSRRNALMKSFHSDVSSNSAECAQKINEAYRALIPLAK